MEIIHSHHHIVDPTHIGSDGALFINPDGQIIKIPTDKTLTYYWMLRHDDRFQLLGGIRDPKDFFKHDPFDVEGSIHSRRVQEELARETFGYDDILPLSMTTFTVDYTPAVRAMVEAGTVKIVSSYNDQVVLVFKGVG